MSKSLEQTKKLIAFTKKHLKAPVWCYEDSNFFDLTARFFNIQKGITHAAVYIKGYTDNVALIVAINFEEKLRVFKAENKDIKKFKKYVKELGTIKRA